MNKRRKKHTPGVSISDLIWNDSFWFRTYIHEDIEVRVGKGELVALIKFNGNEPYVEVVKGILPL